MALIFSAILAIIGIIGFITNGYVVSAVCGWVAGILMLIGMRNHLIQTLFIEAIIAAVVRFFFVHVSNSFFIAWGISHSIAVLVFGILSFLFTFLLIHDRR